MSKKLFRAIKGIDNNSNVSKINIAHIIKVILILGILAFFIGIPYNNFFVKGVFSWHIKQPSLIQDGVELICFFIVMTFLGLTFKNKKHFIVVFFAGVYLSLAGVIIPVITAYIYIQLLIIIGSSFLDLFCKTEFEGRISVQFLAGITVWGGAAILSSLAQFGTINDLRIITLILVLLALLNPKRNRNELLVVKWFRYIDESDNVGYLLNVALVCLFLMLFAKTNSSIESDSLWYGLTPEYNLVGAHSFYDWLGYTSFVYYYPKFKELLFLPISGLKDYSFIISGNIFILILLVQEFQTLFIKLFSKVKENIGLAFCTLLFSTTAIAGISSTAKADILGTYLMILITFFGLEFCLNNNISFLTLSLVSGIISYGTKPTCFLYTTLMIIILFIILIYKLTKKQISFKQIDVFQILFFILAIIIALGVSYRTFKFTGFPIYPIGLDVWKLLGFRPKYLFNIHSIETAAITKMTLISILTRIYNILFDPGKIGKMVAIWLSNFMVFFYLFIIIISPKALIKPVRSKLVYVYILLITMPVTLFSLYFIVSYENPDGNYFILSLIQNSFIVLLLLSDTFFGIKHNRPEQSGLEIVEPKKRNARMKDIIFDNQKVTGESRNFANKYSRLLAFCMSLLIVLNFLVCLITHPSWGMGTRDGGNFNMVKNNFETAELDELGFAYIGMLKINNYLIENNVNIRILYDSVGVAQKKINARVESADEIFNPYFCDSVITSNYENFKAYLSYAEIKGFIIDTTVKESSMFKQYIWKLIQERQPKVVIEDTSYTYYELP